MRIPTLAVVAVASAGLLAVPGSLATQGAPANWIFGRGNAFRPALPVQALEPLEVRALTVQGLRRQLRLYVPERLAARPALIVALHGSGGDGDRFRRLTGGAFDRLAEEHGFVVEHARSEVGRELSGVFAVGYSAGGHLVFRLALEEPGYFDALAAIGAHLPVPEERDCEASGTPVSILLVSGTEDPINPWSGGEVRVPGAPSPGRVISAEATAAYFRELAGLPDAPEVEEHADRDPRDGATVESWRWSAPGRRGVTQLLVHGGGHTLPHPAAHFPMEIVGRTSRDVDGARAIWDFFRRSIQTARRSSS